MQQVKTTQRKLVISWLKTYGTITTRQAVTELNIMSLPRRIMELREQGYEIETTYQKSPAGARYGVYTLKGGN